MASVTAPPLMQYPAGGAEVGLWRKYNQTEYGAGRVVGPTVKRKPRVATLRKNGLHRN